MWWYVTTLFYFGLFVRLLDVLILVKWEWDMDMNIDIGRGIVRVVVVVLPLFWYVDIESEKAVEGIKQWMRARRARVDLRSVWTAQKCRPR